MQNDTSWHLAVEDRVEADYTEMDTSRWLELRVGDNAFTIYFESEAQVGALVKAIENTVWTQVNYDQA